MQEAAWNGLFRRIPNDQHNCLILMTTTGAEVNLQRLIRIDTDFLVALGRPSGSTDEAKVVIIPFSQITYLAFTKKLNDEQIENFLGKQGVRAPPLRHSPQLPRRHPSRKSPPMGPQRRPPRSIRLRPRRSRASKMSSRRQDPVPSHRRRPSRYCWPG